MSFLAPARLVFIALPVGALLWYVIAVATRKRHAVRFSDIRLLDAVAPDRPGIRRHIAAGAAVLALLSVVVAFARPVMAVQVPRERATLVLAVDVSLSMEAGDVSPTRIDAAKAAAMRFLDLAPTELRIGVVGFAGVAAPAVPPTTDRAGAARAIQGLSLAEGTAIGEAIFTSLDVISTEEADTPATIVVLSDGETTVGRPDADAAAAAVEQGVPVSTVSFGTASGSITYQGEVIGVPVNKGALEEVARVTGGTFSEAASAAEFEQILDTVGSQVGYATEDREVWEYFVAAGLGVLVLAGIGSLVWFSRLP